MQDAYFRTTLLVNNNKRNTPLLWNPQLSPKRCPGRVLFRPNNEQRSEKLVVMSSKTCNDCITPCQRKTYEYHRARVRSATSVVDVIPPKVRPHIRNDAKKRQLESERQEQIIRDNFILLKKLQAIMFKK